MKVQKKINEKKATGSATQQRNEHNTAFNIKTIASTMGTVVRTYVLKNTKYPPKIPYTKPGISE